MVLSVKHETRCGDEEGEKGDEILSTDRPAVAPWRQLRRAKQEIENCEAQARIGVIKRPLKALKLKPIDAMAKSDYLTFNT